MVLLLTAVAAFVMVSSKNTEIARLRDDVAASSRTVEDLEESAGALEEDLEAAAQENQSLRSDLDNTQRALGTASACAQAAMRAWTSTLTESYAATGFVLGRVFDSAECREFRRSRGSDASLL
jgi:chromosome segregation ATPase